MTTDDLDRLAELIARQLSKPDGQPWLRTPVRPTPPGRPTPGALPAWAGAAQTLPDVAPLRERAAVPPPRHRPAYDALTAAARAAAAGRGPAPLPAGSRAGAERAATTRTRREVPIGVSNRHLHLCLADFETLIGKGRAPSVLRPISQPGQYAAGETVAVVGPKGRLPEVRLVGPVRGATQLELSLADCRLLGISAPVRLSGRVEESGGGVTLEGPAGKMALARGVIVAQRHLHVAPADAQRLGVADGDRLAVGCGPPGRRVTLHDVMARVGPTHATELHLDVDEAHAAHVKSGDVAVIVASAKSVAGGARLAGRGERRRPLVTERDVAAMAARGERLSVPGPYVVTPAARDRAKALGIWRDET